MFTAFDTFRFAEDLFAQRDFRGAARHLAELVEHQPGDASAQLLLARAYYHSAQLHGAERAARTVIALDPSDAYAQLLLGRTLQRAGRDQDARAPLAMARAMGLEI